jgi:peptidoglycan L-alanyl-D-glutamate endopeptidase CwlK
MMQVAKLAISLSAQDFGFTEEQSRTLEHQRELVRKGVSQTLRSHHIIDCGGPGLWAEPGFSGAVDAVPWDGTKFIWDWNRIYEIAAAFAKASRQLGIPVTWGGCWDRLLTEIPGDDAATMKQASADYVKRHGGHGFVDGPHFEWNRQ